MSNANGPGAADLEPEDRQLLAAFEHCTLSAAAFGHRQHLHVGYALLRTTGDLALAAVRFRAGLRRFTAAHGAADRYHETITWAYLVILAERLAATGDVSFAELLLVNPDLLDHRGGALRRHYDVESLSRCATARRQFVLPCARP